MTHAVSDRVTGHDRHLNPFRVAATARAEELVAEALRFLHSLEHYEREYGDGGRQRTRRPGDSRIFEQQVQALVCGLAHA
jgi:hypothetical protein